MVQRLITDFWVVGKLRQAKKGTVQDVDSAHGGAICRLAAVGRQC